MPATFDARPQPTPAREDRELVDFGFRPVFKEHSRDGNVFDGAAMERIAENCNRRIEETGDFCPLVITHTRDDDENSQEVVGMLGPFVVRPFGKSGQKAIYARERWYRQDADKRRKFPRISVEYWGKKSDPTNGYLDPAALLGSETPELDLGFHYAKGGDEWVHFKYAAVAPGGANTAVPSLTEERPERYQQGTLTQADLQQIVAALKPTIDEAVQSAVARMQPAGADPQGLVTDEAELDDMGLGDDLDEVEDSAEFADDDAEFDADEEGELDDSGDPVPAEHADEQPADEAEDESTLDESTLGDEKKSKYAKIPSGQSQEPNMAESLEQQVTRYQKERDDYRKKVDDLTKERDDYRSKYQKAVDEKRESDTRLQDLTERLNGIESRERKAVRYQKLAELEHAGYLIQIDEELADCEGMDESQFDKHCDRIRSKYARVPQTLASKGLKPADPSRTDADDRKDAMKRDRYSKQAMDNVARARKEGKSLDFRPEFERLMRENPDKV